MFSSPLFFAALVAAAADPISLVWNNESIGGDGPWNSILVDVADTTVALYGVRGWETIFLLDTYCNSTFAQQYNSTLENGCYSSKAGVLSDPPDALTNRTPAALLDPKYIAEGQPTSSSYGIQRAAPAFDMTHGQLDAVPDSSVAYADSQEVQMPNGLAYPPAAGCLGIGTNMLTQDWTDDTGNVSLNFPVGYLFENNQLQSYSYGMHIGSALDNKGKMPGSLVIGGYDQNRVVGDIYTFGDVNIILQDIAIEVIDGESPLANPGNRTGLLKAPNANNITVGLLGCTPFLSLPKATCNAIASELPVDYDEQWGLYFWKTDDPIYHNLISSAMALSFNFTAGDNPEPLIIRVPFMHLNLTLDQPYVDTPRPYFPCSTGGSPGQYVLGRPFLQDAFSGANFNTDTSFHRNWLAQAPGPGVTTTQVTALIDRQIAISKSNYTWAETWADYWTPYNSSNANSSSSGGSGSSASSSNNGKSKSSTPVGAIAGGVVGGVAGLALIGGLIFFLWRRHNRAKGDEAARMLTVQQAQHNTELPASTSPSSGYRDSPAIQSVVTPVELNPEGKPVEMAA